MRNPTTRHSLTSRSHGIDTVHLLQLSDSIHSQACKRVDQGRSVFPQYFQSVHDRVHELAQEEYKQKRLLDLLWMLLVTQCNAGLPHHITSQFESLKRLPDPKDSILVDQPALKLAVENCSALTEPLYRFLDEIWRQERAHDQQHQQRQTLTRRQPSSVPGAKQAGAEVLQVPAIVMKASRDGRRATQPTQPSPKAAPNPLEGEVKKNQTPSEAKSSRQKPTTPKKKRSSKKTLKVSANWSSDVIVALKNGDTKALKAALGGVETPAPNNLQDQIDLEYPPTHKPYGPWGVPLPTLVQPDTDLGTEKKIVRCYLMGLHLTYDKTTHSVRVQFSEKDQRAAPMEKISGTMVARFSRATTKIWKWIAAMKESRKVIPLDEWVSSQLKGKREKYKAAIYEYIESLDIQTQNRCIRKKSHATPVQSPTKKRKSNTEYENNDQESTKSEAVATPRSKSSKRPRKK